MFSLLLNAALLGGLVVVVVCGVRRIMAFQRLATAGAEVRQPQLEKVGRVVSWLGFIIAIGGPRVFGVRYQIGITPLLIASAIYGIGFGVMFAGWQFRFAAFETREEVPPWIAMLLRLWSSFWRDNTEPEIPSLDVGVHAKVSNRKDNQPLEEFLARRH